MDLFIRDNGGFQSQQSQSNQPPRSQNRSSFRSFPADFIVLLIVAIPLLLIRRFESPRRRVSVWFFDLGRLVVGYAGAEVLLLVILMPYTSAVTSYLHPSGSRGFSEHRWAAKQQYRNSHSTTSGSTNSGSFQHTNLVKRLLDSRSLETYSKDTNSGTTSASNPNSSGYNRYSDPPKRQWIPLRSETTSLTLNLLGVFPGLIFIYAIYMTFLYLGFYLKLLWIRKAKKRFSSRDSQNDNWAAYSASSIDLESGSYSSSKLKSKKSLKTDLGFTSGCYGHPVRLGHAVQQTVLFATSVFVVRVVFFLLCVRLPHVTDSVRTALFGWAIKLESLSAKWFLCFILFPSLIYIAQFLISDYVLKYRPPKGHESFVFNTPDHAFVEDYRNLNTHHVGTYELQDIPQFQGSNAVTVSNEPHTTATGVSTHQRINATILPTTENNNYGEEEIVSGRNTPLGQARHRGVHVDDQNNHNCMSTHSTNPVLEPRRSAINNNINNNNSNNSNNIQQEIESDDDDLYAAPRSRVTETANTSRHISNHFRDNQNFRQIGTDRSSATNLEEELEETFNGIKELGKTAWEKVSKTVDNATSRQAINQISNSAVNEGMRLGIVTATLLNQVAANATATARPFIFSGLNQGLGGINRGSLYERPFAGVFGANSSGTNNTNSAPNLITPGLSSLSPSQSYQTQTDSTSQQPSTSSGLSVSEQYHLDEIDGDDDIQNNDPSIERSVVQSQAIDQSAFEHDETRDSLPNYYESQRQHQELLRDRVKAERQHRQIRDLKRE